MNAIDQVHKLQVIIQRVRICERETLWGHLTIGPAFIYLKEEKKREKSYKRAHMCPFGY